MIRLESYQGQSGNVEPTQLCKAQERRQLDDWTGWHGHCQGSYAVQLNHFRQEAILKAFSATFCPKSFLKCIE